MTNDASFTFAPKTAGDGFSTHLNTKLKTVSGQQGLQRRQWNVRNRNYVFDWLRQALTLMKVA